MTNPAQDYSPLGSPYFPTDTNEEDQNSYEPSSENGYDTLGTRYDPQEEVSAVNESPSPWEILSEQGKKIKEKYFSPREGIESESTGKAILRTVLQFPLGYVKKYTALLEMLQPGIIQESLDDMEEYAIRHNLSEEEHNELIKGIHEGAQYLGSQQQIEDFVEEKTGIPLEPHTRAQSLARLGGTAKGFAPGLGAPQITAAAGAPALSVLLQEKGLNEEVSDFLALGASTLTTPVTKAVGPKISKGIKAGGESVSQASKELAPQIKEGSKKLFQKDGKISKPKPNEIIEEFATQETVSPQERGSFEKGQQILTNLQDESPERLLPPPIREDESPSLEGRVTQSDNGLSVRPTGETPRSYKERFQEDVLNNISPLSFRNEREAGTGIKNEIMNINNEVYTAVNELYARSRELNEGIEVTHPELVNNLMERIEEISRIPARGTISNQIITTSRELLNRLAAFDEDGNITGYQPISNQQLIDQIQELRNIIDEDFIHGQPKNRFRPLIGDIQSAVESTAYRAGAPEAVEALREANAGYRTWAEYFDNPTVLSYRKGSNRNFEKLFNTALDGDSFNYLRPILEQSEQGQELMGGLQREMVEKRLEPFLKNPRNIDRNKFDKTLRNLETVTSPEVVNQIREEFNSYSRRFPDRMRLIDYPSTLSKNEQAIMKLTKLTPEQLESKFNTRSGIAEVRETLSKNETQKTLFKNYQNEKIRDILREGQIEKDFSGTDLYNVLNNKKNYELLTEMVGKEEVEAMRQAAKSLANRKVTKENLTKLAKSLGKYKMFKILLSLSL